MEATLLKLSASSILSARTMQARIELFKRLCDEEPTLRQVR